MKPIHIRRLRSVITALREAPNPLAFDMGQYVYDGDDGFDCGTPACALGHYAARTDLQKTFKIRANAQHQVADIMADEQTIQAPSEEPAVQEHFGMTSEEVEDIFGAEGCGGAKTTKAAIRYIERFIAKRVSDARAIVNEFDT